ncbi:MAG: serine protein kinase [Candidatus Niyogibacteria bacterium CG10_big_fil_rev_8_21_14_0_10_42_19]|uniref:Serine protein kinase n=1 Tax=Candidatus Niyogibacteria bacterium CG10_big_fil_rev_8_21_14_0_10_42_19 TaxID=1974725 RepID=A0A2H0TG47_9BACT|nr:MAG: serine protein kinase [Candidatus Niyogibacteria bacterium CG10_big_fil_rev_8_21_14_0_10_42_19]
MTGMDDALEYLRSEISKKERRVVLDFEDYLKLVSEDPERVLRNIFQLFYDMVKHYVGEGEDDSPCDPESIGFIKYDCSRLLSISDNPFFADRLFANRFIRQIESLRRGFQQNRIYAYEGPSGCGKSTFLNNLLKTFVEYTNTRNGRIYEVLWEIDTSFFSKSAGEDQKLVIPCPSHDYPILMIPKENRRDFLRRLFPDKTEINSKIFKNKEYEWVLTGEVCTVCKSIFEACLDKLGSADKVFKMLKARAYNFDRRLGEGISIYNPGDRAAWVASDGKPLGEIFTNEPLQEKLNKLFGVSRVKYVYSSLARTNNGIHVLMDVKGHNEERLLELHNVISEGVHKVDDVEEQVNSLFFALMNPEDKEVITDNQMESFQGRIQYNKIPYVLESDTEVDIYRSIFGAQVVGRFLPRVLENFARVIISSRMNKVCKPLKEWIPDIEKYKKYCDEDGLILRMSIYAGIIPNWLSEEDRKKFTAPIRRALIAEGEVEGREGFSGRDSVSLFSEFFSRYSTRTNLINMENIEDFFKHRIGRDQRDEYIPKKFLGSLVGSYEYAVLNEMKESLYSYNKDQISRDVLNYLYAVNYELGAKIKCPFTGEEIEVSILFFKLMASRICGRDMSNEETLRFAYEVQKKYAVAIAKERDHLTGSDLYKELQGAYVKNLKEKVLHPFIKNPNFREAIKSFNTPEFKTFDTRLKEYVVVMLNNLVKKFGYTQQGAKEICLYVIEKGLVEKFS